MQIAQNIHEKPEKSWLGVFHASAVSDGNNGILFLGDSGNGKSTSLALLQAHGFHCIADDFVPVDAIHKKFLLSRRPYPSKRTVYRFYFPFTRNLLTVLNIILPD